MIDNSPDQRPDDESAEIPLLLDDIALAEEQIARGEWLEHEHAKALLLARFRR